MHKLFLLPIIFFHFCHAAKNPTFYQIKSEAEKIINTLVYNLTSIDGPLEWLESNQEDPIRALVILNVTIYFDCFIYAIKPLFTTNKTLLKKARKAECFLADVKELWKHNIHLVFQHPLLSQNGYIHKNKSIKRLQKKLREHPLVQDSLSGLSEKISIDKMHIFAIYLKHLMQSSDQKVVNYILYHLEELITQSMAHQFFSYYKVVQIPFPF